MTWHTPEGDRVLEGIERDLVLAAVHALVGSLICDVLDDADATEFMPSHLGVEVFDVLSPATRLVVLQHVVTALVTSTETCFPLTAITEGAVMTIYLQLVEQVRHEIDCPEVGRKHAWRRAIRTCYDAMADADGIPTADRNRLPVKSQDLAGWKELCESLSDRVLWDDDYKMTAILDADPTVGEQLKQLMGIDPNYFVAIGPMDPTEEQLRTARHELAAIAKTSPLSKLAEP